MEIETIYWGNLCPSGMSTERRDAINKTFNEKYRARWKRIMQDDDNMKAATLTQKKKEYETAIKTACRLFREITDLEDDWEAPAEVLMRNDN